MAVTLPTTHYIRAKQPATMPACILLPGWGSTCASWQPLVAELSQFCDCLLVELPEYQEPIEETLIQKKSLVADLDKLTDRLVTQIEAEVKLSESVIIGWSLGGMLATHMAANYSVRGLVTLAANASFTQRKAWPWALTDELFERFYQQVLQRPEKALKRFIAMQTQGDDFAKSHRSLLQQYSVLNDGAPAGESLECSSQSLPGRMEQSCGLELDDNTALLGGLTLLNSIDNRVALASSALVPGLHFFGEHDTLVPISAAKEIALLNPRQQCVRVAGASHYIHGSTARVLTPLVDYLKQCRQ